MRVLAAAKRRRVRILVIEDQREIADAVRAMLERRKYAVDVASDAGLRAVCERAGLDWQQCIGALADDGLLERVEANTARLAELGHWGVPVFDLDGELFWGQDRIEDVEQALFAAGCTR